METNKRIKQRKTCKICKCRMTVYASIPRDVKWTCPICASKIAEEKKKEEAIRKYEARRKMTTSFWWNRD